MDMNILVVDDDEVLRDELTEYLIREGYNVETAESGTQALNKVKERDFSLVFTDLKMPGMNGIEVLREVKRIKPNMHMVMITAYGTIDSAVEAMKIGADDYLRKPFEMEHLQTIIENVVQTLEFEKNIMKLKKNDKRDLTPPFDYFKSIAKNGVGLCISPRQPSELKEEYDLPDISMIWLSESEQCKMCMHPNDIYELKLSIFSFFNENPKGVVILDGMEYIMEHHPWDTIKKFVIDIMEHTLSAQSHFIFSLKPDNIPESSITDLNSLLSNPYIQLISDSLSSPIRRHVIRYLSTEKSSSFTGILNEVKVKDAPKLSFHLRRLIKDRFIKKDSQSYEITERGKKMAEFLKLMEEETLSNFQNNISLIIC